jgi:hypothetical protein
MGKPLILDVPEDIYESLLETAKQTGQPPEELAVQCLVAAAKKPIHDPIEQFIGAFSSNGSDWADQHDKHLGNSLIAIDPCDDVDG